MTRVADLLRRKSSSIVTVEPEATLARAVDILMGHGVGGVVVLQPNDAIAGFLSERDIIGALRTHTGDIRHVPVTAVMRRAPTCDAHDPVDDVMRRMTGERLRHLVVLDGHRAVGVISVGDIVKHRLEELETETGVLRDYVAGQRAV
jgi:CBS domain-containing protein